MIIYELVCEREHVFEGWFKDSQFMNEQLKRGMVACPICDSKQVQVKPSAFGIMKKRESTNEQHPKKNAYHFYKAIQEYLDKNFIDVGPKFAENAIKMHYGEIEKKNIKGTATPEEERELIEEGVQFFKINLPKFDA